MKWNKKEPNRTNGKKFETDQNRMKMNKTERNKTKQNSRS